MIPLTLSLSGFRTFPHPVTFHFPPDPGLYFISGENQDEPRLDGNGVGKTTLFEALPYCLYGRTSKGDKGPQVASWAEDAAPTRVGFTWKSGDTATTFTRGYKPTASLLQTKELPARTVEQLTVDEHVGLTREQFLAVVLFAQFGTGFMDLTPAGQLAAFSTALKLDQWAEFGKKAAAKVSEYKDQSEALTAQRARALGICETAKNTYNLRADEADAWDAVELQRQTDTEGRRVIVSAQLHGLEVKHLATADAVTFAALEQAKSETALAATEADYEAFKVTRIATLKKVGEEIDAELLVESTRLAGLRDGTKLVREGFRMELDIMRKGHREPLKELAYLESQARDCLESTRESRANWARESDRIVARLKVLRDQQTADLELQAKEQKACEACGKPLTDKAYEKLRAKRATEMARRRVEIDDLQAEHFPHMGKELSDAIESARALVESFPEKIATTLAQLDAKLEERRAAQDAELLTQDQACDELAGSLATGRRSLEAERLSPANRALELVVEDHTRALRKARSALARSGEDLAKANSLEGDAARDVEAAQKELDTLTPEPIPNPHDEPLETQGKSVDLAESEVAKLQAQFDDLETRIDRYGYWAKAFPRLRLWLLQGAAMEFQIMVQNALDPLGLDGWEVECKTTRELKTGTEVAQLTTLVTKPGGPPVPIKSFSGGEGQRLRNAGKAAFADVVRSRMAQPPSFEMWDEPTAHLSPQGCDDLMAWLRERARVRGRQVWVIDHRTRFAGEIDAHFRFILREGETRVETDL